MTRKRSRNGGWALAVVATWSALAVAGVSHAADYTFVNIVDTTHSGDAFGPFTDIGGPRLNDSGVVSFRATEFRAQFDSDSGVFTGSGGPLTTIADTVDTTIPETIDTPEPFNKFNSVGHNAINDAGLVVFRGGFWFDSGSGLTAHQGLFTSTGDDTFTTIADNANGSYGNFSTLAINTSGVVAFRAFNSDIDASGIFTGSGGPVATIVDMATSSFDWIDNNPDINDAGTVAFLAGDNDGSSAIYTGSGGPLDTVISSGGAVESLDTPRINNAGQIAFSARLTGGVKVVYVIDDDGTLHLIADNSISAFEWLVHPMINNHGDVVFAADLAGGGRGLFTGPDPLADKVIAVGDPMFGSIVTALGDQHENYDINDHGHIAFWYVLENGVSGIALAIPEPASLGLFACGGLMLMRRRR